MYAFTIKLKLNGKIVFVNKSEILRIFFVNKLEVPCKMNLQIKTNCDCLV